MAVFKNDPFPGTNYAQYLDWEKVTLPSGEVYYVVPGHSGYVYDPVASNATGRKVFRPNPQKQIESDAEKKKQQDELIAQQKFNQSPAGQLIPVGATVAGLWAANHFLNGGASAANALAQVGANAGASTALGNAAAQGATAVNAGIATPEVVSANVVPGAAPAASSFSLGGIGSAGNLILPAVGAVGAFDVLSHDYGAGRGGLEGAASGAAIGSYFGPQGALIGAGIGGLVGVGKSLFHHETTKEHEKKQWGGLASSGGPATKAFAQQYLQYLDSPQAKADAERAKTRDPKIDPWKPEDVWGGLGMFKTFGEDWLTKYSEQQRRQISQELLNQGLISSEKGDLVITDQNKARQIKDQVIGGTPAAPAPAAPAVVAPDPPPGMNVPLAVSPQAQAAAQGAVAAGVTGVPRGPFGGPAPAVVVPVNRGPFGLARG